MLRRSIVISALGCLLLLAPVASLVAQDGEAPTVEGWSVGLGVNDVGLERFIGARLGYWGQYVGFDTSLQSSAWELELADTGDTVLEQAAGLFTLGVKGGSQVGFVKWFVRLGLGGYAEEVGDAEITLGYVELGGGVDFAATDNLILGIRILDLRAYSGEFDEAGFDSVDIQGAGANFLTGGHISFQF